MQIYQILIIHMYKHMLYLKFIIIKLNENRQKAYVEGKVFKIINILHILSESLLKLI